MASQVQLILGPASVRANGICSVFGCDISDSEVEVPGGKVLPFEPGSSCKLTIKLRPGGLAWKSSRMCAGTRIWHRSVKMLLSAAASKGECLVVIVVGGTDRGKSSFSLFLANTALAENLIPAVIDSDVGQADLGPPGVISSSLIKSQLTDLRQVRAGQYRFVGSTNPPGFESIIATGISELTEQMKKSADVCIINTDGYIASFGGARYKAEIVRKINPDFVVTLGRLPLLRRLAGDGQWRFVFVESNCQGTKRRELRERRRIEQFNRFLGANHVARRVANLCFLYKNLSIDPSTLGQFPYSFEGMFVGLGDREMLSGFGLILKSNDEEIVIQTAVENFDTVHLSKIRVAESHRKSAHRAL